MGRWGKQLKTGMELSLSETNFTIHQNDDCIMIMKEDLREFVKEFNKLVWDDIGTQLKLSDVKGSGVGK